MSKTDTTEAPAFVYATPQDELAVLEPEYGRCIKRRIELRQEAVEEDRRGARLAKRIVELREAMRG